jgi:hypothetical protein
MREFLKTSLAFTIGLIVVLACTDRFLGWRQARLHGKLCLSPEIYVAIDNASRPSRSVHSVLLGDSVAHGLFYPGSEKRSDERFLTSNQAGSLGAQYYILADAIGSFPNLRDVYLLYYPGSFENDLGPPLANDYFCGFFHSPAQIREVFGIKRDARLLFSQTGRMLLPNILATNSVNRPLVWEEVVSKPGAAAAALGQSNEPLADVLDWVWGGASVPPPRVPSGMARPVMLSSVSQHFLPKMRELCRSHGVAFHILPCPCSDAHHFSNVADVYDRPIIYLDPRDFGDQIHIRLQYRKEVRRQLDDAYGLPD